MRILHAYKVFKPEVEGGIPEVIATLVKHSPERVRSRVLVCRSFGIGSKYSYEEVPVVASTSLGTVASMPLAPFYIPRLVYSGSQMDLVVHHAPFPLTDLASLALPSSTPIVVHWHAEIVGRALAKAVLKPAIHACLTRAKKIIVSHPVMATQSDILQLYQEKCVDIPYGVDVEFWGNLTRLQEAEVELLKQRHPRLVVAVGRLVEYKGYRYLLEALQNVDAELFILGDGPLRGELTKLSCDLGVDDKVKFIGRLDREQIKLYLHAAKILVLASVSVAEAFGIVQAEAMAAGLPVINTNLPTAVPYVARHEREGLTVPPKDPAALHVAINKLLENDELRSRLGKAAASRAQTEFSHRTFRDRSYEIYRGAIEETATLN